MSEAWFWLLSCPAEQLKENDLAKHKWSQYKEKLWKVGLGYALNL